MRVPAISVPRSESLPQCSGAMQIRLVVLYLPRRRFPAIDQVGRSGRKLFRGRPLSPYAGLKTERGRMGFWRRATAGLCGTHHIDHWAGAERWHRSFPPALRMQLLCWPVALGSAILLGRLEVAKLSFSCIRPSVVYHRPYARGRCGIT
jgi:hypothetical protein